MPVLAGRLVSTLLDFHSKSDEKKNVSHKQSNNMHGLSIPDFSQNIDKKTQNH